MAISSSEVPGAERPLAAVQREDLEAAVDVGDVDGRPGGRSGPAAAAPGRGCRGGWWRRGRRCPASPPKPSISTSSAFSVCSRSSLPWPTPAPRLRPAASSSSMKIERRRHLARLGEEVADARRADADQRLDEVRAGEREEGGVGLAGGRLGEQRLAGAGRADEQHALRRAGADRGVLARVGEVVADLAQLGHRLAGAGDVVEGGAVGRVLRRACGPCR